MKVHKIRFKGQPFNFLCDINEPKTKTTIGDLSWDKVTCKKCIVRMARYDCGKSGQYRGKKAPTCLGITGCDVCWNKFFSKKPSNIKNAKFLGITVERLLGLRWNEFNAMVKAKGGTVEFKLDEF